MDLGRLGERRLLAGVVLEAMHLDPEARFQSAEEIVEALEAAVGAEELTRGISLGQPSMSKMSPSRELAWV